MWLKRAMASAARHGEAVKCYRLQDQHLEKTWLRGLQLTSVIAPSVPITFKDVPSMPYESTQVYIVLAQLPTCCQEWCKHVLMLVAEPCGAHRSCSWVRVRHDVKRGRHVVAGEINFFPSVTAGLEGLHATSEAWLLLVCRIRHSMASYSK